MKIRLHQYLFLFLIVLLIGCAPSVNPYMAIGKAAATSGGPISYGTRTYQIPEHDLLEIVTKVVEEHPEVTLSSKNADSGIVVADYPFALLKNLWGGQLIFRISKTYEGSGSRVNVSGSEHPAKALANSLLSDIHSEANRLEISAKPGSSSGTSRKDTAVIKTGTGFFVSRNGHIITNNHVIESTRLIKVALFDGTIADARVIKQDPANDVALLKIDMDVEALPISESNTASRGDDVFTLGYPLIGIQGQEQKATFGHINSTTGLQGDVRFFQIDIPIQPGNSGGPLINNNGNVIGIVTSSLSSAYLLTSTGTLPQNVNYAVKSDYFMPLIKSLTQNTELASTLPTKNSNNSVLVKRAERSVVLIIAE